MSIRQMFEDMVNNGCCLQNYNTIEYKILYKYLIQQEFKAIYLAQIRINKNKIA